MGTIIQYDNDAREKLLSGVRAIAKGVKVTLEPSGKNVLIRNSSDNKPFATKDGVTVAGQFRSDDPIEQIAIEAMQDVANMADSEAGDGTTTATILAEHIFETGYELCKKDDTINLFELKKGIDYAVKIIVEELNKIAKPCKGDKKLREVAMIASNQDEEVSKVVVEAFNVAGQQGVVNIKRSRTSDTYLSTIEGTNLPTGFLSRYFDNTGEDFVDLDKPYVYITNEEITSVTDNLNYLLSHINTTQSSLLIVCKGMEASVLNMLVKNKLDGVLKVCVCKAPGFGNEQIDELEDLALVLGTSAFIEGRPNGFNDIKLDLDPQGNPININQLMKWIPRSEQAVVTLDRLSVKGPHGLKDSEYKAIEKAKKAKADQLRKKLEKQKTQYEKGITQSRISKLTDGLAYIHIGALTDIEYTEKQHRVQDALYAVKSANEEGIIPGGGNALRYVSHKINTNGTHMDRRINDSFDEGVNIILTAAYSPFYQIIRNTGIKLSDDIERKLDDLSENGIDAKTGKYVKNMFTAGIIDPLKVTRVALENAASIAGMLLTTDCVIVDTSVYDKPKQQMY